MTTRNAKNEQWVVVTTRSRPWLVACGRLVRHTGDTVVLCDARCAVYYSPATRSVFGLAARGPAPGSRVSEECAEVEIGGVEVVVTATAAAVAQWARGEWS